MNRTLLGHVTGHFKGGARVGRGGAWAQSSPRSEKLQKAGGETSPCETKLGLLTGVCQTWAPVLPQTPGDGGPAFRCWLEQTVREKQ